MSTLLVIVAAGLLGTRLSGLFNTIAAASNRA
jgi:hypothetical protein